MGTRRTLFPTPWHALGLLLILPLVLGLVALGGGGDQTFADGAMMGVFCVTLVGLADVVTRLVGRRTSAAPAARRRVRRLVRALARAPIR